MKSSSASIVLYNRAGVGRGCRESRLSGMGVLDEMAPVPLGWGRLHHIERTAEATNYKLRDELDGSAIRRVESARQVRITADTAELR